MRIWRMRIACWIRNATHTHTQYVEASRNVMAHAQKPHFVFRRNGPVHLHRRGRQFSRGVRISGANAGYTMFRGIVKSTGYPLHSPVSPLLPFPCVTVCHHILTGLCLPDNVFIRSAMRDEWVPGLSRGMVFTTHFLPKPGCEWFGTRPPCTFCACIGMSRGDLYLYLIPREAYEAEEL